MSRLGGVGGKSFMVQHFDGFGEQSIERADLNIVTSKAVDLVDGQGIRPSLRVFEDNDMERWELNVMWSRGNVDNRHGKLVQIAHTKGVWRSRREIPNHLTLAIPRLKTKLLAHVVRHKPVIYRVSISAIRSSSNARTGEQYLARSFSIVV